MRAFPIAAVAISALLLAGCAQTAVPGATTPTPSVTPSPTVATLSEKPVTLTVGQAVDLSGTRGLVKATVTVDEIEENAECASGEETPELGQFVAVTLSAVQGADKTFDFATYTWLVVGVDGVESDARAEVVTGRCVAAADRLGTAYDASGRVTGTVLLDAPAALSRILVRNTLATPPVTLTIELPPR
ncbi:MAG: hypothetical protein LBR33_09850 [Propionibacteriaceae bacterium]|jgi:hypothetical protein|nr:hypothetical protein [Propionibacteriaceae bacterium]